MTTTHEIAVYEDAPLMLLLNFALVMLNVAVTED
jgi:hypothetical protein